jgi:hypothetical protein
MHENHRLWRLLALLTAAEKKRLLASLPVPPTALARMAAAVLGCALDDATRPDAAALWGQAFPGRPFEQAYFKNLESDLVQLVCRFLVQLYLEAHPGEADRLQHRELLRRNCPVELQESLLGLARRRAGRQTPFDPLMDRELRLIAVELAQKRQDRRKTLKRAPEQDLHLTAVHASTVDYLLVRLRLACDQQAARQASPHLPGHEMLPFAPLLEALAGLGPLPGLLGCYAVCEKLLRTGEGYAEFKAMLLATVLPRDDRFQLVIHAQNHCVQQSNLGKQDFLGEYLDWMDYRDQHQLLLLEGVIAVTELKNMITACIKLEEVPRGRTYLERFIGAVPPALRDYFETLNSAHLSYAEGDFRRAKRHLLGNPALDQFDDLDWRTLLLKLHVETIEEDYIGLEDFVHAFQNFLRRCKTLPAERIHLHKAKLSIVEAIMKAHDLRRLEVIEARIMEQSLPEQAWLLNFCAHQRMRIT